MVRDQLLDEYESVKMELNVITFETMTIVPVSTCITLCQRGSREDVRLYQARFADQYCG